jgi:hypothetical protein
VLGAQVMWKGLFSCLMIWSWHLNQQLSTRSVNSNFMNQYGVQPIPKSRVVHTFALFVHLRTIVPCRTESTFFPSFGSRIRSLWNCIICLPYSQPLLHLDSLIRMMMTLALTLLVFPTPQASRKKAFQFLCLVDCCQDLIAAT